MKSKGIILLLIFCWFIVGLAVLNYQDIRLHASPYILKKGRMVNRECYLLVPGAGKDYVMHTNFAFEGRIQTTIQLWKQYHFPLIILSGINSEPHYVETGRMYVRLREAGIPSTSIAFDNKAYNTLQSIMNYHKSFGQHRVIIISQKRHLERAIWMAQQFNIPAYGIEAFGFPDGEPDWFVTHEVFACIKARFMVNYIKATALFNL